MKSEKISPSMSFRSEMTSKLASDAQAKNMQSFSSAMENASKKSKREVQRDEPSDIKPPMKSSSANQNESTMVQRPTHGKTREQVESSESKSSSESIDSNTNAHNDKRSTIADYLLSLSLATTSSEPDANSAQDQAPTESELASSAAQTSAILALMSAQIIAQKQSTELSEPSHSLASSPSTSPILQTATVSINAFNSTRQPSLSANSLEDEVASLLDATPSTLLGKNISANQFETSLADSINQMPSQTTTDSSQILGEPQFSHLQSLPTFTPHSTEMPQSSTTENGRIAMGNGDEFAQSTTSFLVKAHANGSHEAVLKVSPEHLGPLRADIAMNELPDGSKSMSLTLTLSNEHAMDMAKENIAKLQSELALAGISCPTIQLKMDTPIAPSSQTGASEGSLHSSSNPSNGQQSPRDEAKSKRSTYEEQTAALSPTEKRLTINLFDRTV